MPYLDDAYADGNDLLRRRCPSWRFAAATTWAAAGAGAAGGAWWAGLALARAAVGARPLAPDPDTPLLVAAATLGGAAAGLGLVLGGVAGLARGGFARAAVTGLLLAAVGGVAGALSPVAADAAAGTLPAAVSSSLVWAAAGLVAGAAGYTWGRVTEEAAEEVPVPAAPVARASRPCVGPLSKAAAGRVLPTATVAVACVVGAMVGTPSPVGWAVLAVGVLGLAVTWALVGQERRLQELERRLPRDSGRTEPVDAADGGLASDNRLPVRPGRGG